MHLCIMNLPAADMLHTVGLPRGFVTLIVRDRTHSRHLLTRVILRGLAMRVPWQLHPSSNALAPTKHLLLGPRLNVVRV